MASGDDVCVGLPPPEWSDDAGDAIGLPPPEDPAEGDGLAERHRRRRLAERSGRVGVWMVADSAYEPSSSSAGPLRLHGPAERREVTGLGVVEWRFVGKDGGDIPAEALQFVQGRLDATEGFLSYVSVNFVLYSWLLDMVAVASW